MPERMSGYMEIPNAERMILSELYEAVGGDLTEVLERLEDVETVELFVLEFADDPSYSMLLQSLQESDLGSAFRAAHTLKGIGYSLGFKRLGDCSVKLCEKLREGTVPSAADIRQFKTEYNCVISAIKNYKNDGATVKIDRFQI